MLLSGVNCLPSKHSPLPTFTQSANDLWRKLKPCFVLGQKAAPRIDLGGYSESHPSTQLLNQADQAHATMGENWTGTQCASEERKGQLGWGGVGGVSQTELSGECSGEA